MPMPSMSNSSAAAATSGDAQGSVGGARFNFEFGGNPNAQTNNYLLLSVVAVIGLFVWTKYK